LSISIQSSVSAILFPSTASRNDLSHVTKIRPAEMAEDLFWAVLAALQEQSPGFRLRHRYSGQPRRFKRAIDTIDSTIIQLVANCLGWAKHSAPKGGILGDCEIELTTPRAAVYSLPGLFVARGAHFE
jgi:hypothetical protein